MAASLSDGDVMALTVISGGKDVWHSHRAAPDYVRVEDVEAEASRRLRAVKLNEWRVREFVTGTPMPPEVRHFELQVSFAAKAISRLSPIPADFAADVYWPVYWAD